MLRNRRYVILVLMTAFLWLGGCESGKAPQEKGPLPAKTVKATPPETAPPDALARVGDQYVTVADYEAQLSKLSPKLAETEQGRIFVIQQIVDSILLAKEAQERGVTKDPVLAARIEDFARSAYKDALLQKIRESRVPISDEDARKFFLEHKEQFVQPELVHVSLIEAGSDSRIQSVYGVLKGGKAFADVARAESRHASAQKGGDLGLLTTAQARQLYPGFSAIKPGDISKPFKSSNGWAIVKVNGIIKKEEISQEEGIRRARAKMEALQAARNLEALIKNQGAKNPVAIYEEKIKGLGK
jgi:peptidyl-prolyl cis-trans isomerase C